MIQNVLRVFPKSPTSRNERKMSEILKFAKPSTLTYHECIEHFKAHPMRENVHMTHICTMSPVNYGVCYGDSGKAHFILKINEKNISISLFCRWSSGRCIQSTK